MINVRDFGATGNGVTDDSAAIRSAITACAERSTLHFPIGTYLVSQDGANPWCLNKKASMRFTGETMGGSVIQPNTTVPDTCDVVREVPSTNYENRGGGCSNIGILDPTNGTRAGRDAWRIDTTTVGFVINSHLIERLSTGSPTAATPGYAFRHINAAGNIQGGMFASVLRDCNLVGGFCFTKTGDSNSVRCCRTSGPLPNIVDQICNTSGSANMITLEDINATNKGGLLQVTNAPGLVVTGWNGENLVAGAATFNGAAAVWLRLPAPWSGATAYVVGDLVSSSSVCYRCILAHINQAPPNPSYWAVYDPFENVSIHDNLLSIFGSFDGNTILRIEAGNGVSVSRNRLGVGLAGVKGFIVGAAAVFTDLRRNRYPDGIAEADKLTNSGANTIFDSYGTATQATSKLTLVSGCLETAMQ